MLARKDKVVAQNNDGILYLFKKNKVAFFHGMGSFAGKDGDALEGRRSPARRRPSSPATHVIVATGSKPRALPGRADRQRARARQRRRARDRRRCRRRLGVVGAGVIGLEMGSVWRRLGAEVTMLEALPAFLRRVDATIAKEAQKLFAKQGLAIHTGVKITDVEVGKKDVTVDLHRRRRQGAVKATYDHLIVSIGRVPFTGGLKARDRRPRRSTSAASSRSTTTAGPTCRTSGRSATSCAARCSRTRRRRRAWRSPSASPASMPHVDFNTIPWVIYTSPEIAWVGKTEQQLKADGVDYRAGQLPVHRPTAARAPWATRAASSRSWPTARPTAILGVHMIGPMVSELISEGVVAMEFGASSEDIARICHAHPTLSEAMQGSGAGGGRPDAESLG